MKLFLFFISFVINIHPLFICSPFLILYVYLLPCAAKTEKVEDVLNHQKPVNRSISYITRAFISL
jgi:hypothetical protein